MRREGSQHGMVRTGRIPPSPWASKPEPRFIQRLDSPLTAGLFIEVSKKPTNRSKFTGRCGKPRCLGCHMHPACKAKNKTKGSHKLRSIDMTTNSRFITWSVADGKGKPGLKFSGFSATSVLNHLYNDIGDCCKGNDDHDGDDGIKVNSQSPKKNGNTEDDNTHENLEFVLKQDAEEADWYIVEEI